MELSEKIIEKGKIPLTPDKLFWLSSNIIMTGLCLYGFYALNYIWKPDPFKEPVDFYNVCFVILIIVCCYLVFLSIYKLRISFYECSKANEKKERAIERVAGDNKWKLKKAEPNYYVYWENNWIFESYYVTIIFDEKGFYINCYPFVGKFLDFGASSRRTEQVLKS